VREAVQAGAGEAKVQQAEASARSSDGARAVQVCSETRRGRRGGEWQCGYEAARRRGRVVKRRRAIRAAQARERACYRARKGA